MTSAEEIAALEQMVTERNELIRALAEQLIRAEAYLPSELTAEQGRLLEHIYND